MKISKLFHWLYAVLMLLPVFFITGRVAYTIFNKNAKDSYTDIAEYQTINDLNELRNYLQKDIYVISTNNYNASSTSYSFAINYDFLEIINSNIPMNYDITASNRIILSIVGGSSVNSCSYSFYRGDMEIVTFQQSSYSFLIKVYLTSFINASNIDNFLSYNHSLLYKSASNTLDNAFIYSVNKLNEEPLFSWAKDSFLVTPFTFITGLFGVPSDSPINTILSYWLDISIIWLVFDLVMYLPLLIHRWLDKGVLE